jgi:muramoyltetrapeptide carboxypeptidase
LQNSTANLSTYDLGLKVGSNVRACAGYMAGTAQERLDDLHAMYRDPEVQWVIASRGGRSANQLLGGLDFDLVNRSKKPLIGFSDITILLNALYARNGQVQIHGPMITAGLDKLDEATYESLLAVLERREQSFDLKGFGEVWKSGKASGILLGGNLMTVECLLGTPYEPDWTGRERGSGRKRGSIFFWEEEGEPISRLHRTLVHLKHAGVFDKISGMVIGNVHNITGDSPEESACAREVNAFLKQFFSSYKFPCIKTEFFGHEVSTQISLPVGGLATITASELRLSFPDKLSPRARPRPRRKSSGKVS